ncbi:thioredoxin-like protein [Astrocystis sublimbata]|nr:thioredoxin-like protein [Astrocystis sublimbata]
MPSPRRLRYFFITVLAIVITILFFTSQRRQSTPRDPRTINSFFGKTVNGLDQQNGAAGQLVMSGKGSSANNLNLKDHDGDGSVDEDDEKLAQEMADRLKAAEQQAKDQANAKAPHKPDAPGDVIGVGSSAGGQKKGKSRISKQEEDEEDEEQDETKVDQDASAEVTLRNILKRSPVVIFSKSYCPYSKKAKGVLLEKYIIDPAPYVVELDEHPMGRALQDLLLEKTGRKTVPNILINGQSVGGSDDIAELDTRKTLIDKFKSLSDKKFTMKQRFTRSDQVNAS